MLSPNSPTPNFTCPDQTGKMHQLSDYKGSWLFIYFYPKDQTPGCTTEACSIRDSYQELTKCVKVLGVSPDSQESHQKFISKHDLPFPLLADTDKKMVNDYQVWQKKKFMGREYFGVVRTSFLIDPQGKIAKIYEKVNPKNHVDEILADLKKL